MKKFKYDFTIQETTADRADKRMAFLTAIANKFTTEELEKVAQIVNNPSKLAFLKSQL